MNYPRLCTLIAHVATIVASTACGDSPAESSLQTPPDQETILGVASQALNSVPVYADPSGAQTIDQSSGPLSVSGSFNATRIEGIRYADQFPGSNMGQQIKNAIIDLGGTAGRIVIPPGVYSIPDADRLVVDGRVNGIILEGSSAVTDGAGAATLLTYTGSTAPFISARGAIGFTLRNVQIGYTSSALTGTLIDLYESAYAVIEDCTITNATADMNAARLVSIEGLVDGTLRHNHFAGAVTGLEGGAYGMRILNNRFNNFVDAAIRANYGINWTISDNTFEPLHNQNAGALVATATYLQGLVYSANYHGDSNLQGTWVRLKSNGAVIQGNTFNAGNLGIELLDQSLPATITGNTFANNEYRAIRLAGGTYGINIEGNLLATTAVDAQQRPEPIENIRGYHQGLNVASNYHYPDMFANREGFTVVSGYGFVPPDADIYPNLVSFGSRGAPPNAGSISWGNNSGWKMHFGTSATGTFTPRVTMVDTGNVGIGTQAPNATLEVNGGVRLNSAATQPACTSATRGTIWVSQGGTTDQVSVCVLSGGTLGWHAVAIN